MIISVEDKYDWLYDELRSMGHEVYRFSENVPSDVIVYSGMSTHITSLNNLQVTNNGIGAFLINGDGKSGPEINSMITNKSYSSLF